MYTQENMLPHYTLRTLTGHVSNQDYEVDEQRELVKRVQKLSLIHI